VLVLAALNFVHALPRDVELHPAALGYDFRAFYCAGTVVDHGADPYLAGPLRTCEHVVSGQYSTTSNVVIPAPLPGYALAPFALAARLPFWLAATLWLAILLASLALTVAALRSVTGLPLVVVFCAVALADGWISLVTGQLVPVVVAAVAACGWCVERRRYGWAAVAGAVATLEPQVGLAVCAALFVWVPATRVRLVLLGVVVGGVALAGVGVHATLEYLTRALPAQVRAETAAQEQYSLTYLLHRMGASDGVAVGAGNALYALALVLGVALARILARGPAGPAALAFVPAAAAAISGPYVHLHQIAVVLPAALLCAARLPAQRALFGWSVLLLAIPWGRFLDLRSPLIFVGIVCVVLAVRLIGTSTRTALWTAAGTMLFIYAALDGIGQREFEDSRLAAYGDPQLLASTVWGAFVRAIDYPLRTDITFAVTKLPTFVGLGLLAYGIARALRATPVREALVATTAPLPSP